LGLKKVRFGIGLWNGFGGKVEEGETVEEAAKRELLEESGIEALDISKKGILEFTFEKDPVLLEVHIFLAEKFNGTPIETKEMKPQWFSIDQIPFDEMWSDDRYWVPLLLDGKKFKGAFLLDKPSTKEYSAKIIKKELIEVEKL
jgi:8-oxo-dGTP diphosphatase/2-hydroxy-dATP diphosphatase